MKSNEALLMAIKLMNSDQLWGLKVSKTVVASAPALVEQAAAAGGNLGAGLVRLTSTRADMDQASKKEADDRRNFLAAVLGLTKDGKMDCRLEAADLKMVLGWVFRLWVGCGGGSNQGPNRRAFEQLVGIASRTSTEYKSKHDSVGGSLPASELAKLERLKSTLSRA